MKKMEKVTVIGAGTMGHSIALSIAWSGLNVTLIGINDEDINRAKEGITNKLHILQVNGLITSQESVEINKRIKALTELKEAVEGATFIIEAIPEDLLLKKELFKKLDELCDHNVILASNTSGLSPTNIAQNMKGKERVVVTHFWNPAHLIPLVEVVRGEETSDATVRRSIELLKSMRKRPIEVKKDILGSVVNRLQYALFREAQYILEQGAASMEDIDAAVIYSIGRRLPVTGPFMTADMGGLDVFDSISNYLFEDLSNASSSLKMMQNLVANNKFGQKSGEGFYQWDSNFTKMMNEKRENLLIDWLKQDMKEAGQI